MGADPVSTAKLVIYLLFFPISLFCIYHHRKLGVLGWWYVIVFCVLRIVTGAMGIHGNKNGETYTIINSIGLSPLMLAASGILYEARKVTNPRLRRKLDVILEIQYHALVMVGMVMIVIAIVHFEEDEEINSSKTLLDVGSAISSIAWVLLVLRGVWSYSQSGAYPHDSRRAVFRFGKLLIYACLVTLPFIAIRIAWGLAFLQLRIHHPDSGFLTSEAVTVCLNVVPEMIITAVFLAAGVCTHTLNYEIDAEAAGPSRPRRK